MVDVLLGRGPLETYEAGHEHNSDQQRTCDPT
jgi:hypothetical protein